MRPVREFGFLSQPVGLRSLGYAPDDLKGHAAYRAAKAGDAEAAAMLIADLVAFSDHAFDKIPAFPDDGIIVAPHAVEAAGDNAIPMVLAAYLAHLDGLHHEREIVQVDAVFHTGASAMQRLIARPSFAGGVQAGRAYIIVDDVTTMGTTIADLADYIRYFGGSVAAAVVLASASRTGNLAPARTDIGRLRDRLGDSIRDILGIETEALTADEARYLVGFRTADELRGAAAKAAQERDRRLRARGLRESAPAPDANEGRLT